MSVIDNLEQNGLKLPDVEHPAAALYNPYIISGNHVYVSGQLPMGFGDMSEHVGQLGTNMDAEKGAKIAEYCMLNALKQVKDACGGDLGKVKRCVKITVFVNSAADFTDQPKVANGASNVIVKAFGTEKGQHSRSAIGNSQLPFGVAVEVEAIFEI